MVSLSTNVHGLDPTDLFCLRDLWSLHLYSYHGDLRVEEFDLPIRPGYIGITPPGAQMLFRYHGLSAHIYAHFRLPAITASTTGVRRIRAMMDLGDAYETVYSRLERAIGVPQDEVPWASARLWDLLWELSTASTEAGTAPLLHPKVRRASEIIERTLADVITISSLADAVGVSAGHLVRLFQQAYGESVIAFIRRRRVERAMHLIQRSTLPIKIIAASVGMPDLQHFNKAVRSHCGKSPRSLRDSAG